MAHYACGCWDAEIKTSYGWIECVGHADRSAYDLTVHARASKKTSQLVAFVPFPDGPREVDLIVAQPNRGLIGTKFKSAAKSFFEWFDAIKEDQCELTKLKALFEESESDSEVEVNGLKLTKTMFTFKTQKKKVTGRNITPGVIEPAFGIGRIVYSVLEHSFWVRESAVEKDADDDKLERSVLSLKPIIAPYKCIVLPLISSDTNFLSKTTEIESLLKRSHITAKVDKSSLKIGKRYSKADEIGIPFALTIDEVTMADNTVTFRERDSTQQVRVPIHDLPALVDKLVDELITWKEVVEKYGLVTPK